MAVERKFRLLVDDETSELSPELEYKAGFSGSERWMCFVQCGSRLPVYRLVVEGEGGCQGLLSLAFVNHPIFGRYLTTAPFASYGGFAALDQASQEMLLKEAGNLAAKLRAAYVLVRHEDGHDEPPEGWVQSPGYATYRIELPARLEDLMGTFSSDHRNHIRKSLKKGFSVRFGREDLLDDAYRVISASMHELGSPYHKREYFKMMLEKMGEAVELMVIRDNNSQLAGGGVIIYHGNAANNLHANILRNYRPDYAGEFLYWAMIERACQLGKQSFDLGRSLAGSGNEVFKMKWSPARYELGYWYGLQKGHDLPNLNQKNPKFQLAISMWKRFPQTLVDWLGPYLIRGLA